MKRILLLTCLGLLARTSSGTRSLAQGTAFTYQGRLEADGQPAQGPHDLRFTLYDAEVGGSQQGPVLTHNAVPVTEGLFAVTLDFGAGVFTGAGRWLEIGVRPAGGGAFTPLSPRQPITAAPYALYAMTPAGPAGPQGPQGPPGPPGSADAWSRTGNAGTTPAVNFLGTTDNQPLELRVNNARALRLEPTLNDADRSNIVNVVAGSPVNTVSPGVYGATISGGGAANWFGTVASNRVDADFGTLGGGLQNTIQPNALYATIPGGRLNSATNYAFAAGRRARANHTGSFVWADSTNEDFASTAHNQFNLRATGGIRVSDNTPGLFFGATSRQMLNLWGTQYAVGVQSFTTYFRSSSRFSWFFGGSHADAQNNPGAGGSVGMTLTIGGLTVNGAFVSASDRHAKENFAPVDAQAVLEKVVALPLSTWNYKSQDPSIRHLGPMAQDFKAAFGLGESDTGIATVDADGVALAAIQGLNAKVESGTQKAESELAELRRELNRRDAENAELRQELQELQQLVRALMRQSEGGAQ